MRVDPSLPTASLPFPGSRTQDSPRAVQPRPVQTPGGWAPSLFSIPYFPEAREISGRPATHSPLKWRPQPLQPEEGGETCSVTSRAPERSDPFIPPPFFFCFVLSL